jgi:hypothetical protein
MINENQKLQCNYKNNLYITKTIIDQELNLEVHHREYYMWEKLSSQYRNKLFPVIKIRDKLILRYPSKAVMLKFFN